MSSETAAMADEDISLPEGVDSIDDVRVETDVEGFVKAGVIGEFERPFNPQNGRLYDDHNPGCAQYDSTEAVGAIRVNCAYQDCSGFTNVTVKNSITSACPDCNAPRMGRSQFSTGAKNRRSRHASLSDRTTRLRDDFSQEMKRLTDAGAGTVAAMDYLMCSVGEIPYEEWAESRGVSHASVKRNISRVADALGETVTYKTRG